MKKLTKRVPLMVVVVGIALATAVGGLAYWTTSGSGSGTAAVASSNGTVTLAATVPAGIYPGGSRTVSFTASNSGDTNLYVGTVSATSITADAGHSGCNTADFSMANVAVNEVVLANASNQALGSTGTLQFANTTANQDACKGATLTIALSST